MPALGPALVQQLVWWFPAQPLPADHVARLVQENVPVLENSEWTKEYFEGTLRDLTWISLHPTNPSAATANSENTPHPDLIVWPESPAPFYASDPAFREAVSNVARQAQTWMLVGSLGVRNAGQTPEQVTEVYNSAALVSPAGEWVGRYDKVHLVPFGEYVPL